MSLREHLLAAQSGQPAPPASSPTLQDIHSSYQTPTHHHIDPAIGGSPGQPVPLHEMEVDGSETRRGRRELSTSKRAAQNRAAQRAFRQRKEQYIQSLKDQVKEHQTLAQNYETIQKENFQLRQYIITLQARLLESHTELPPPPDSIDLSRGPPVIATSSAPTAHMASPMLESQLQAAAVAASNDQEQEDRKTIVKVQPTDSSPNQASRDASG
ncbi:hypothetical protein, variant 1 [Verruconis gallopava]|uniref:Putative transcription factor kapC n=1 Tax=Verruconis gallopava TaxID=253628 RepID=A0A0D2ANZ2_9PEZI|nr:hypothetical protein, variant 1 [Verruconis gallopava]KIW08408.1 hypothetical protein, variant 1 [Verruconis gallopava]